MKILILKYKRNEYINKIICLAEELKIQVVSCLEYDPRDETSLLSQLSDMDFDAIVAVIWENKFLERVLNVINGLKIENVFVARLFAIDTEANILDGFNIDDFGKFNYNSDFLDRVDCEKPYCVHVETHVVDHCNLNCKACNNFSPFVKTPLFADIDTFEKDIERLASLYSGIGRFFLLGGEPLLAPQLCCDMIKTYRKYFPNNELRVLTNASLILQMQDGFWDIIRSEDVIIHISLYPPIKERIEAIEKRLQEKNVKYIIFKEVTKFLKHWTAFPFEDAEYNNVRCGSSGCHFLRKGMLYKCPDSYLIGNVDGVGEELKTKDGISIFENDSAQIIKKLTQPIDLCKKCSFKRAESIVWEPITSSADPADWFLPNRLEVENSILNKKLKSIIQELEAAKASNRKLEDELTKSLSTQREYMKLLEKSKNEADTLRFFNSELKELNEKEHKEYKEMVLIKEHEKKCLEAMIDKLSNDVRFSNEQSYRVNNSISYRLGLVITFLPRKMYKFLLKIF